MELFDEVVAQAPGLTEPGLQIRPGSAKSRLPPRPMGAKPSSARPPGRWSRCGSAQPSSVDPALLPSFARVHHQAASEFGSSGARLRLVLARRCAVVGGLGRLEKRICSSSWAT